MALLGLELLNELASLDTKTMGSAALLGVVPAVMEYAAGAGSPEIARSNELRLQASLFIQQLAQLNLVTAQLLIACKVQSINVNGRKACACRVVNLSDKTW